MCGRKDFFRFEEKRIKSSCGEKIGKWIKKPTPVLCYEFQIVNVVVEAATVGMFDNLLFDNSKLFDW